MGVQTGANPMLLAASCGNLEVVDRLIAAKCNVNKATAVSGVASTKRLMCVRCGFGWFLCAWLCFPRSDTDKCRDVCGDGCGWWHSALQRPRVVWMKEVKWNVVGRRQLQTY
eukprot:505547-Rhodomonas_salina.6